MENFDYPMTARILALKEKRRRINKDMRLDFERNRIITEYYQTHKNEYPILKRAGFLHTWLTTREINIDDDDIFLGDSGPHCRTVHFDIEQTPINWIESNFGDTDERFKAAWQVPGSVWVDDADREWILEAAKFWEDNNIAALAIGLMPEDFMPMRMGGPGGNMDLGKFLSGSYPGHFCPNYKRAVTVGFGECRRIAQEKLEAIRANTTSENVRSELFYMAYIKVCDGMIAMSKRYAEGCRKKAAETADPVRKAELLQMADSCDWIMEHPARTLWEGIQSLFFYLYLLIADGTHWADSPGLIDEFLGPLAEKDIAEGRLTRETAQELIDAFVLHIGDQIIMFPKPNNQQLIDAHAAGRTFFDLQGGGQNIAAGSLITIGGQTPDGKAGVYNIVTEMVLLGYLRLKVAEPSLALRINKYTPDRIWAIAIQCSIRSGGMPQFNNDDVIIQAMLDRGVPIEDARQYAVFGCVEPAISGKEWSMAANCGSFGAGAGPIQVLQYIIHGNEDPMGHRKGDLPCKKLYEYESFEELQAEFERQAKHYIDKMARMYHFAALVFRTYWPILSASMMTEGCLEKGLDVSEGGAKYNGMGSMINAIATIGDSLYAIKKLCFEDKTVTTKELYDAIMANWEGHEMLRQRILNALEHYGNDDDGPDSMVVWFTNLWVDYFNSRPGVNCGTNNCGALDLAWVMGGRFQWATPDGRKTGDPLSISSDPRQDCIKNGPLAYVKSVAKMPWVKLRCGGAINSRFDANSVKGDDATAKVRNLISTYFRLGGIQYHFTVADSEVMREAQKHPEDYQDLIVRIAGFSAYFTHMSKADQDDYINRFELGV